MSKLVSFDGIFDDLKSSFTQAVDPVDVALGAVANRLAVPFIQSKVLAHVIPASDPAKPSQIIDFLHRADVNRLIAAGALAVGALLAQGGNKASKGHVVGILGIEVVDFAGQKLASALPMSGLVEYGMLTRDAAYGMLTRDASYGAWPEVREPTPYDLAALAEDSQSDAAAAGEGDREIEYA